MKQHQLSCVIAVAALICCTHSKTFAQADWHITGNSGTNPTTNFIGTKDNIALSFRINNAIRMRIGTTGNVGIGSLSPVQRLDVNGNINIGKGFSLFMENRRVLRIDSVNGNTFLGNGTGFKNAGGFNNTANGYQVLPANTTGNNNSAFGVSALAGNTTGSSNTGSGVNALGQNTTGNNNSAFGVVALIHNTTGSQNTALGHAALFTNSIGSFVTAIGDSAGSHNLTGNGNTFLGNNANCSISSLVNSTALGNGAIITASDQVRIGNSNVTSIGGFVGFSNISDGRVKKNIKENVPGLTFINKLHPITYNLNLEAADNILQAGSVSEENKLTSEDKTIRAAKEQTVFSGFVAQDVEKAAKELNYDFSGVDAAKNDKDLYGLRYAEFVVPLVKAVQELSQKVEKLEAALVEKNSSSFSSMSLKNVAVTDAALGQNIPNPFNRTTTISYTLPQKFSHAQIIINDNSGNTIKQVNISGTGKGVVNIDGSILSSGTYNYSLVVDGKLISSKQMVLAK